MKDDTKAIYEKSQPSDKCSQCQLLIVGSKYRKDDDPAGEWVCAKCYYNE